MTKEKVVKIKKDNEFKLEITAEKEIILYPTSKNLIWNTFKETLPHFDFYEQFPYFIKFKLDINNNALIFDDIINKRKIFLKVTEKDIKKINDDYKQVRIEINNFIKLIENGTSVFYWDNGILFNKDWKNFINKNPNVNLILPAIQYLLNKKAKENEFDIKFDINSTIEFLSDDIFKNEKEITLERAFVKKFY